MKEEKIYIGHAEINSISVLGKDELKKLKYAKRSVFLFAWGYLGDAPGDTALAILSDYTGKDMSKTPAVYQKFKFDIVAHLKPNFVLSGPDIQKWLDKNPDYKEMITSSKSNNRQPR